jgi:hypothetical protein
MWIVYLNNTPRRYNFCVDPNGNFPVWLAGNAAQEEFWNPSTMKQKLYENPKPLCKNFTSIRSFIFAEHCQQPECTNSV